MFHQDCIQIPATTTPDVDTLVMYHQSALSIILEFDRHIPTLRTFALGVENAGNLLLTECDQKTVSQYTERVHNLAGGAKSCLTDTGRKAHLEGLFEAIDPKLLDIRVTRGAQAANITENISERTIAIIVNDHIISIAIIIVDTLEDRVHIIRTRTNANISLERRE